MQLSPESCNVRSSLPDSGEHVWPDPTKMAGLLRIQSDPVESRPFWPNPAGSVQIRSDSCHFDQIWPASDHGQIPTTVAGCCRITAPAVIQYIIGTPQSIRYTYIL
jgi:hypothetical protein